MTDQHATALATWVLSTIGNSLLWAILGAVAIGVAGGLVSPPLGWILGALAGPVIFGWRLKDAKAPAPVEDPA